MVSVPSFLLKRLYVKGSLRNTQSGFQFELKNTLGSGYGTGLLPLLVDGQEVPKENSYFISNSQEIPFSEVSEEKPFTLGMNKACTILVKGMHLSEGAHRINFRFIARGLGELGFEIADAVK